MPEPSLRHVPRPPAHFVGREDTMPVLHAHLAPEGSTPVVTVWGMPGVGKTALAAEYVNRYSAGYDDVWWVPANPPEAIGEHLAGIAGELGLPEGADAMAVRAELRRRRRWLLIFDDAGRPDDIVPFVPAGNGGSILVTSRQPGRGGLGTSVELPALGRGDSIELLAALVPTITAGAAHRIARAVHDLPLALVQVAHYLDYTAVSPPEYADLVGTRLRAVTGRARGDAAGRPLAVISAVVEVTLEWLGSTNPAAVDLLGLCASCAAVPVRLAMLREAAGWLGDVPLKSAAEDDETWHATVGALTGLGLAGRGNGEISVHRLAADAARRVISPEHRGRYPAALQGLFCATLPGDIESNQNSWPQWRALLPHVLAVLDERCDVATDPTADLAWLCEQTATYLLERGQAGSARRLLERALSILEALYDDLAASLLASIMIKLGSALQDLGEYEAARQRLDQALAISGASNTPLAASILIKLGSVFLDLGDPRSAFEKFEHARTMSEELYGPDDILVASSANGLGSALLDLGLAAEAQPYFERALAIAQGADPSGGIVAATYLNNLGIALHERGDARAARPLLERALGISEEYYGRDHASVAANAGNLASVLRDLGQHDRARSLFERALDITEAAFGAAHQKTLAIRGHLEDGRGPDAPNRPPALKVVEARPRPDLPASPGADRPGPAGETGPGPVTRYTFFTSYADNAAYRDLLNTFHTDLAKEVAIRAGRRVDQHGFLAHRDIRLGSAWEGELRHAACTTPVLVALLTDDYFRSHWCGWEWAVFTDRTKRATPEGGRAPACILPVTWVELRAPVPAEVRELQLTSDTLGPAYAEKCVVDLMRLHPPHDYLEFVIALAEHVVDATSTTLAPLDVDTARELPPTFGATGIGS